MDNRITITYKSVKFLSLQCLLNSNFDYFIRGRIMINKDSIKQLYSDFNNIRIANTIKKELKKKISDNNSGVIELSKYQKEEITTYWSKFGIKPDLNFFKWIYSVTGKCDCRFIPEDVYARFLMPNMYNAHRAMALDDKNYYDLFFCDVKTPKSYIHKSNGVYMNDRYQIISEEEALNVVEAIRDNVVVKPTIGSCKGYGVRLIHSSDIRSIISEYGDDIIIQECIKAHHDIASLNEKSSNVIRITSLIMDNEVHILSPTIRVGDDDRFIDQGGKREFCIGIDNKGRLKAEAISTKNGIIRTSILPNGKVFGGMPIPAYNKMLDIIRKVHPRLSVVPLIGWDLLVDSKSDVILLECNLNWPGISKYQECNGPFFGELTTEVLNRFILK